MGGQLQLTLLLYMFLVLPSEILATKNTSNSSGDDDDSSGSMDDDNLQETIERAENIVDERMMAKMQAGAKSRRLLGRKVTPE